MANKLVTVTQLDKAVDGFASAVAAAGYEKKANLKKLAYEDDVTINVMATELKTLLEGKMTQTKAQQLVNQNVGKAYKPGGSKTLATLPALTESNFGHVYHMTEEFTTTADFIEGAGKTYTAGTEVAIVETDGLIPKFSGDFAAGEVWVEHSFIFPAGITNYSVGDIIEIGYRSTDHDTVIPAPGRIVKIESVNKNYNGEDWYDISDVTGETPTVSLPIAYKYNVLSSYIDTTKFASQSSFSVVQAAVQNILIASNSDIQSLIDGMSLDEDTSPSVALKSDGSFLTELVYTDGKAAHTKAEYPVDEYGNPITNGGNNGNGDVYTKLIEDVVKVYLRKDGKAFHPLVEGAPYDVYGTAEQIVYGQGDSNVNDNEEGHGDTECPAGTYTAYVDFEQNVTAGKNYDITITAETINDFAGKFVITISPAA